MQHSSSTRLQFAVVGALIVGLAGPAPFARRAVARAIDLDIDKERLLLGDVVAGVQGPLATLDLGPTPQPGQTRTLSRAALMRRLRHALIDVGDLVLPDVVHVRRTVQTVTELDLRRLVSAAVSATLPDGIQVRDVLVTGGMVLPGGRLTVNVQAPRMWQPGRQVVRVGVEAAGSRPRQLSATVDIAGQMQKTGIAVTRGAQIHIIARGHGLLIQAMGVAQQNGAVGDEIAVLANSSQKIIKARVQNAQTVEVEL